MNNRNDSKIQIGDLVRKDSSHLTRRLKINRCKKTVGICVNISDDGWSKNNNNFKGRVISVLWLFGPNVKCKSNKRFSVRRYKASHIVPF